MQKIDRHVPAALCAGFLSALCANPFDFCKSRMMGQAQYRSMWHCASTNVAREGPLVLWRGFLPNWARIGPRVVVVFLAMEELKRRFGAK